MATASHVFVKQYIKGRNILNQDPAVRNSKKNEFLKSWILEYVPFLKMVSKENLEILLENMTLETYKARELVFQQEDFNINFYIILRGTVAAMVDSSSLQRMFYTSNDHERRTSRNFNGLPLSHLRALQRKERTTTIRHAHSSEVWQMTTGDYFGQESLIMKEGRALYSVRSLDHAELLVIDGTDFDEVLKPYFHKEFFEKTKLLYSMGLFQNCSLMSVRILAHMLRERKFHFGECLFRQKMCCSSISIIAEGSAKLSSDSSQKTPFELLEKIRPPKDHLSEILMEGKAKRASKNMANTTHYDRRISKGRQPTGVPTGSAGRKVSAFPVRSSAKVLQNRRRSAQKDYEVMGFVLHQPSTHPPSIHICTLVKGDMLGDIESRSKLGQHLFSAVCASDTTIYEINTLVFEAIMHKRLSTIAHQMVERCLQKVEAWQSSHPAIQFFGPMATVLTQITGDLEEDGAHKLVRKMPKHETPESLAMACVNGLDFQIPETNSETSAEFPIAEMPCMSDDDSISSAIMSQFGYCSAADMGDAETVDPELEDHALIPERVANSSIEGPISLAEVEELEADLKYYPPLYETRAMKERNKRLFSFDAAVPFGKRTINKDKNNSYKPLQSPGQDSYVPSIKFGESGHEPDDDVDEHVETEKETTDGCGKLSLAKIRYDVKYSKEQSLKKRDSFNVITADFVRSGSIRPLHKLIPDLPQISIPTRVVADRLTSGRGTERLKSSSMLSIDGKLEPVEPIAQVRRSQRVKGDCVRDSPSATMMRHFSDGSVKVLNLEIEMVRTAVSSKQNLSASKQKIPDVPQVEGVFVPHPWTIMPPKSAPDALRVMNMGPRPVDHNVQKSPRFALFRNSRSCSSLAMPFCRAPANTPLPPSALN